MKIKEELYVSELAEILDIRTQSIYERLKKKNNIIQNYIVPDSDPVRLYKAVIEEVYNKDIQKLERRGKHNYTRYFTRQWKRREKQ